MYDHALPSDEDSLARARLVETTKTIVEEAKNVFERFALIAPGSRVTDRRLVELMVRTGLLPSTEQTSMLRLLDVGKSVARGHRLSQQRLHHWTEVALRLSGIVWSRPLAYAYVLEPDITLYSDTLCTQRRDDVVGVLLVLAHGYETTTVDTMIYPTTRRGYYKPNVLLTWEWTGPKTWQETWYIVPRTKRRRLAWNGSGEFAGRMIDDTTLSSPPARSEPSRYHR